MRKDDRDEENQSFDSVPASPFTPYGPMGPSLPSLPYPSKRTMPMNPNILLRIALLLGQVSQVHPSLLSILANHPYPTT